MTIKTIILGLAAALLAAGCALIPAWASVLGSPGVPQVNSPDVYACVNGSGGIDYLEFRVPVPHRCWFAGESLWRWSVNPTPAPTVTATSG